MSTDIGQSIDELWRSIVEVHNESKALFLLCEEVEPRQFRAFVQPFNELRHAYEHLVRCQANKLGVDGKPPDADYQRASMGRTLGHEYRGFFDVADWLAIILRESIQNSLRTYSTACITASLPDYYSKDRVRVFEISEEIAKIRGDKDIARKKESEDDLVPMDASAVAEVRKYKAILSELREIHKKVLRAAPALEDFAQKTKKAERSKWFWAILASLATAFVIWVVSVTWSAATNKNAAVSPGSAAAPSGAVTGSSASGAAPSRSAGVTSRKATGP